MKKFLLPLLTAILLSTNIYLEAQQLKPYGHIKVSPEIMPHFQRLTRLLEANEIYPDYSVINSIEALPLLTGVQGYWSELSGNVILNYYMLFPKGSTKEERDDLVLLTLAHEIGHSQMWQHIGEDSIGLMNPSAKYDYGIVKGSIGAEQYILNTYKARLCKD